MFSKDELNKISYYPDINYSEFSPSMSKENFNTYICYVVSMFKTLKIRNTIFEKNYPVSENYFLFLNNNSSQKRFLLLNTKYSGLETLSPKRRHRQTMCIMFNTFSILYQTYLTQNLFLTSFHQTPVSFLKTCFWLYESFICRVF